jgi:hypothetical protein
MADELAGLVAAEVAVEAGGGQNLGIVQRPHAPRQIVRPAGGGGVVAGQPVAGAAVAGLAADAVGDLEGRPASGGVVGVAAETGRRPGGVAQAQPALL